MLEVTICDLQSGDEFRSDTNDEEAQEATSRADPPERIEKSILLIRGQKVLLDFDLADLYDVEIRALVQSVKRNIERFPDDFMFQLTTDEFENWRSQFVISNSACARFDEIE